MTTELISPKQTSGITSRWVAGIEVFSLNGKEYVRGEGDLVIIFPAFNGAKMSLVERSKKAEALCPRHKSYRAIRKPRTNCEECWEAYGEKHA